MFIEHVFEQITKLPELNYAKRNLRQQSKLFTRDVRIYRIFQYIIIIIIIFFLVKETSGILFFGPNYEIVILNNYSYLITYY